MNIETSEPGPPRSGSPTATPAMNERGGGRSENIPVPEPTTSNAPMTLNQSLNVLLVGLGAGIAAWATRTAGTTNLEDPRPDRHRRSICAEPKPHIRRLDRRLHRICMVDSLPGADF